MLDVYVRLYVFYLRRYPCVKVNVIPNGNKYRMTISYRFTLTLSNETGSIRLRLIFYGWEGARISETASKASRVVITRVWGRYCLVWLLCTSPMPCRLHSEAQMFALIMNIMTASSIVSIHIHVFVTMNIYIHP